MPWTLLLWRESFLWTLLPALCYSHPPPYIHMGGVNNKTGHCARAVINGRFAREQRL